MNKPQTGREALQWAAFLLRQETMTEEQAVLESRLLLGKAWRKEQINLITSLDDTIPDTIREEFCQMINKRIAHEPLQYLLGKQEFMGLSFKVKPGVLIPRWDTEILAEQALKVIKDKIAPDVLDIGTGSGAIAVSLSYHQPSSRVYAVDLSSEALALAEENARDLGVLERITFLLGDLFNPLPEDNRFDLIVSNPPYISEEEFEELPLDVKQEPISALVGGKDGLDYYRMIAKKAPFYLKKDGSLLFEIGWQQGQAVTEILKKNDFREIEVIPDYSGKDRVVKAKSRSLS